jgi:cell division protein FtsB
MLKESIKTLPSPANLTDKELIRFADEAVKDFILGMTREYQQEVLTRFENLLNRVADGDLVEPDNTNEELESEVCRLEDEVSDLEREVDRLTDELDALKEQPNQ